MTENGDATGPVEPDEPTLEQEAATFAREQVARGMQSFDDILDGVVDYCREYENDEARLEAVCRTEIAKAFDAHLAAQATWPAVTDCDRLDRAFEALNKSGIVAQHDFACCQNCGFAEIGDEIDKAFDAGIAVEGFTFYHMQDAERAVEGDGIYLSYGHLDGGEESGLGIARRIVAALDEAGLRTEWNGSFGQRIHVPLDWKRRISPEMTRSAAN